MAYVFDNNVPLYLQVIDIIKKKIISGDYQPGDQLESVRYLAGEFEINPNTIQRALSELENQRLLFSQRTRGRYVTEDTNLIKEERFKMSQVLIEESIKALYDLGFTNEDILDAYKKVLFKEGKDVN
ncbi:DNA-binding transcriptional repressor MngR [Peptostreptococcus anaerobius]|uniref:DNA-binding transcriptional repressor MngR n=1 Tax=Peptostreptococcus anaerobius TaxID=1261 RepID=A0A379CH87_9FIRM|nr:GntR family transcriptional regulator [Peptostreptococcus anaerobius]EKX93120.1 transcriptional regulator, GntR family [Peptostreptococcus anaerobius VPI 4330 = DSM 2949]MDB8849801.1 GntR family transcriptional regulator [Peptostreptococcus anaerobius]MDB8853477.1 GntR family transcriptional regulator [Peptostreptococcus anaerobius]MDB8855361.1 GntR family transcriptional regulator [Peptostreptococcus anaerobius]SFN00524.1 GntR family transcriptional regulator [Peptostreptococcus anaerobius